MRFNLPAPWKALLLLAVCAALAFTGAQATSRAQEPLMIGSQNTAIADPPVPRPTTTPIAVPLFSGLQFADFSPKLFTYTPPTASGPWAKIVLVGDFAITAGNQFDRTAQISLGYANVYFGTTPEPSSTFGPTWHVERDLTDYSSLLSTSQPGEVDLGNLVDSTYTGVISGSAYLLFYPADRRNPAPETPDMVIPFPDGPGGAAGLSDPMQTLSETITFPTNVTHAYLDLITQSQGNDEFWYTDVPSDLSSELEDAGGTAFREAEITVDTTPAGVAPVYPWIYTGGIDPFLWTPIPGVQTLNFVPYRVDLTPFAGLLNDGQPHTVSISIYNDNNYFSVAGSLFLYRDPFLTTVPGALTRDTLAADPSPVITSNITVTPTETSGPVAIVSNRDYAISGYLDTSRGRVETTVEHHSKFVNRQNFTITDSEYLQVIHQETTIHTSTTTRVGNDVQKQATDFDYPLTLRYDELVNTDGSASVKTTIAQGYVRGLAATWDGFPTFAGKLFDVVTPTDTLNFDSSGNFTGNTNQKSAQTYLVFDTFGDRYGKAITAKNGVLTEIENITTVPIVFSP